MSDLCVFAANFTQTPEVHGVLLRESCKRFGIELHEYGIGEDFQGWKQMKCVRSLEFLKTRTEPYALMLDAFDCFVFGRVGELLNRYFQFGSPIVIAAEKNCFPHPEWSSLYEPISSPWPYVNSGCIMGQRVTLAAILEQMLDWENDDQACWSLKYLHGGSVALDTHCALFQTMWHTTPDEVEPGHNKVFDTRPIIWHFNGKEYPPGTMQRWYEETTNGL